MGYLIAVDTSITMGFGLEGKRREEVDGVLEKSRFEVAAEIAEALIQLAGRLNVEPIVHLYRIGETYVNLGEIGTVEDVVSLLTKDDGQDVLLFGSTSMSRFMAFTHEHLNPTVQDKMIILTDCATFQGDMNYAVGCETRFIIVNSNKKAMSDLQLEELDEISATSIGVEVSPENESLYHHFFLGDFPSIHELASSVFEELFEMSTYTLELGHMTTQMRIAHSFYQQDVETVSILGFLRPNALLNMDATGTHFCHPIFYEADPVTNTETTVSDNEEPMVVSESEESESSISSDSDAEPVFTEVEVEVTDDEEEEGEIKEVQPRPSFIPVKALSTPEDDRHIDITSLFASSSSSTSAALPDFVPPPGTSLFAPPPPESSETSEAAPPPVTEKKRSYKVITKGGIEKEYVAPELREAAKLESLAAQAAAEAVPTPIYDPLEEDESGQPPAKKMKKIKKKVLKRVKRKETPYERRKRKEAAKAQAEFLRILHEMNTRKEGLYEFEDEDEPKKEEEKKEEEKPKKIREEYDRDDVVALLEGRDSGDEMSDSGWSIHSEEFPNEEKRLKVKEEVLEEERKAKEEEEKKEDGTVVGEKDGEKADEAKVGEQEAEKMEGEKKEEDKADQKEGEKTEGKKVVPISEAKTVDPEMKGEATEDVEKEVAKAVKMIVEKTSEGEEKEESVEEVEKAVAKAVEGMVEKTSEGGKKVEEPSDVEMADVIPEEKKVEAVEVKMEEVKGELHEAKVEDVEMKDVSVDVKGELPAEIKQEPMEEEKMEEVQVVPSDEVKEEVVEVKEEEKALGEKKEEIVEEKEVKEKTEDALVEKKEKKKEKEREKTRESAKEDKNEERKRDESKEERRERRRREEEKERKKDRKDRSREGRDERRGESREDRKEDRKRDEKEKEKRRESRDEREERHKKDGRDEKEKKKDRKEDRKEGDSRREKKKTEEKKEERKETKEKEKKDEKKKEKKEDKAGEKKEQRKEEGEIALSTPFKPSKKRRRRRGPGRPVPWDCTAPYLMQMITEAMRAEEMNAVCILDNGEYAVLSVDQNSDGDDVLAISTILDQELLQPMIPQFAQLSTHFDESNEVDNFYITQLCGAEQPSFVVPRSSWFTEDGIEADFVRIRKNLKKFPERIAGFYVDVNRMRMHAYTVSIEKFLPEIADQLVTEAKEFGDLAVKHAEYVSKYYKHLIPARDVREIPIPNF